MEDQELIDIAQLLHGQWSSAIKDLGWGLKQGKPEGPDGESFYRSQMDRLNRRVEKTHHLYEAFLNADDGRARQAIDKMVKA